MADVENIEVEDLPRAPIIYFEHAPNLGHLNGVFSVTLITRVQTLVGEQVGFRHCYVAHLRGNAQAMLALKHAIEGALLLAAPTEGVEN